MSDEERPLLLRNIRSRVIALLLAIVTWYVVYGAISHEHEIVDIPITVSLTPGWAVLDRSAETVVVRFRGSREDIRSLETQAIQVIVDMRGEEKQGARVVELRPGDVKAPGSARPLSLRPSSIELTLDKDAAKTVPVKANLSEELPPGIEMKSVVLRPATVEVSGPQTLLSSVNEVRTRPIPLSRRFESFRDRVEVPSPDTGRKIRIDPASVTVEMELIERSATLTLEDVPLRAQVRPGELMSLSIDPGVVEVVLSGDPEFLSTMQKTLLSAYIDCSGVEAGAEYELPVRIHAPGRVTVVSIQPPVATVRAEKTKAAAP